MAWQQIVDIGHTAVMLPAALALTAWMLAGRAWKMALCWCLMFGAGLAIVALSKIAYLGWHAGVPALAFQALSGHALRATAVLPVLGFIVLQGAHRRVRTAAVLLGLMASLFIGALLVYFRFHTTSEVLGSTVLGLGVSLGFIRAARHLPAPRLGPWTAVCAVAVLAGVAVLKPSAINHRLVDVALYFSGRDRPYGWYEGREGMRPPPRQYCERRLAPGRDDPARGRLSRRRY